MRLNYIIYIPWWSWWSMPLDSPLFFCLKYKKLSWEIVTCQCFFPKTTKKRRNKCGKARIWSAKGGDYGHGARVADIALHGWYVYMVGDIYDGHGHGHGHTCILQVHTNMKDIWAWAHWYMVAWMYKVELTRDINLYARVEQGGMAQLPISIIYVHNFVPISLQHAHL